MPLPAASPIRPPALAYLLAGAIGVAVALLMLPWPTIQGDGGLWTQPGRDLAQNLAGHLAGQSGPTRWPLLLTRRLSWPEGLSIAMTDSNPLLTLWGKAVVVATGAAPRNWFGVWLFACWALQPVAAVYAMRGLFAWAVPGRAPRDCPLEGSLAAALLCAMTPSLFMRYPHINLLAHFLLLAGLGLVARMLRPTPDRRDIRDWAGVVLLQTLTVLVHPYLFVFNAVLFLAVPLEWWRQRGPLRRAALGWATAAIIPIGVFVLLSGVLGGGDKGFGFYSMNLLSPVWPQRSGLFGAARPILDATGGQYEGFNYLGGGTLLLLAVALLLTRGVGWRRHGSLLGVLAGLTLLAVTPRVFAGPWLLVPFGTWPWDQVFGTVRASGRAFWTVGYAVLLVSVARLCVMPGRAGRVALLAAAVLLQWMDTAPVRQEAQAYYAAGEPSPVAVPVLPAGLTLLRTAPVCLPAGPLSAVPDLLRLHAIEAGAAVADMRASRQPRSFNCESALSDALETAMRPGEVRAIIGDAAQDVRAEAFGPGVTCRWQEAALLCGRGVVPAGTVAGAVMGPGAALPRIPGPGVAALAPLLATGWRQDAAGQAWSEGPRASLLLMAGGPGVPLAMELTVQGIGDRAGAARSVVLRVGDAPPRTLALPDLVDSTVRVVLPWPAVAAPVQVAFDIYRPVNPRARGLAVPNSRVGLVLGAVGFTE